MALVYSNLYFNWLTRISKGIIDKSNDILIVVYNNKKKWDYKQVKPYTSSV